MATTKQRRGTAGVYRGHPERSIPHGPAASDPGADPRYTGRVRIYLAASMTTPAAEIAVIRDLLAALEGEGHLVPSRHVADAAAAMTRDAQLSDAQLAARDLAWLADCDALIAEVSTPSHGVGVEVMAASAAGIPVLALARHGVRVSRLLGGLPGVRTATYRDGEQALAEVAEFLNRLVAGHRALR